MLVEPSAVALSPAPIAAAAVAAAAAPPARMALLLPSSSSSPVVAAAASLAASAAGWVSSHRIQALLCAALVGAPALALLQGAYFLARYRSEYGDAPVPLVPCRGIVVASASASASAAVAGGGGGGDLAHATMRDELRATQDWAAAMGKMPGELDDMVAEFDGELDATDGGVYRTLGDLEGKEELGGEEGAPEPRRDQNSTPLRLLVIGDSLAAGVGTSQSCTPVLPRSIAFSLSRDLGGRPVQWTCLGEPGASAGWIAREIEAHEAENGGGDEDSPNEAEERGEKKWRRWWRDKLDIPGHHPCLDSDALEGVGRYDVAVLLTGPNDLKFAVLPFMLQGEDVEFRREAKRRGGDYAEELRRVLDALVDKMKEGLGESMEKVRTSVEESIDKVRSSVEAAMPENLRDRMNWTVQEGNMTDGWASEEGKMTDDWAIEETPDAQSEAADEAELEQTTITEGRPLVVLTALPARHLPVLRWLPVRWLALALLGVIERVKRTLAQRYPDAILYVDAPNSDTMRAFERRKGPLWEKLQTEKTVISVIDKHPSECETVVSQMRQYYSERDEVPNGASEEGGGMGRQDGVARSGNRASDSSRRPKFRPGSPGATLLSADKLHPNDLGYDFWGRYIAKAIIDEWTTDSNKQS